VPLYPVECAVNPVDAASADATGSGAPNSGCVSLATSAPRAASQPPVSPLPPPASDGL
jgi:hypothetical protein